MPQVGNRKFAYTAAGIRQAMKAAKNMKRRPTSGRPLPRPRPGTMRPRAPRAGNPFTKPLPPGATPGRGGTGFRVPSDPMPLPRPRPGTRRPNPNIPDRGPNRRPRPPVASTSSPQGQMNGIEALAALSQQFGGGQGMNIGGGPYGPPAPAPRQPNPNIPDRDPKQRQRRMNIRFPRN